VLKPASAGASPWGGLVIAASSEGGAQAPALEGYFVEVDQLDTPRAIVNAQGTTVWRWESDPFGDTVAVETPSANVGITTPFGYSLRFPGQVFDGESGLNYNYFRDYEAATGRYVQSDPIGLLGELNTFRYAASRPNSGRDINGLKLTVTSAARPGVAVVHTNIASPCASGTSGSKGKAGEKWLAAAMAAAGLATSGNQTVVPPSGSSGRAITDNSFIDGNGNLIGVEVKCGPCARYTKNQKQNYGPATTGANPQFYDILTFWLE